MFSPSLAASGVVKFARDADVALNSYIVFSTSSGKMRIRIVHHRGKSRYRVRCVPL